MGVIVLDLALRRKPEQRGVNPDFRLLRSGGDDRAILSAGQDAILRPPEVGDARCEPDAKAGEGDSNNACRHVHDHAVVIIVGVRAPLETGQILCRLGY